MARTAQSNKEEKNQVEASVEVENRGARDFIVGIEDRVSGGKLSEDKKFYILEPNKRMFLTYASASRLTSKYPEVMRK